MNQEENIPTIGKKCFLEGILFNNWKCMCVFVIICGKNHWLSPILAASHTHPHSQNSKKKTAETSHYHSPFSNLFYFRSIKEESQVSLWILRYHIWIQLILGNFFLKSVTLGNLSPETSHATKLLKRIRSCSASTKVDTVENKQDIKLIK